MSLLHSATCCLTFLAALSPTAQGWALESPDDSARAEQILSSRCYACHGQDGADEGGFNAVLSRERMVATKRVLPGQPAEQSLLYRKIASGSMPPDEGPLPAEEQEVLRRWIESGAPDFAPALREFEFITPQEVFAAIRQDLEQQAPRYREYQRYFNISHLYNARRSEDELQTYRHGLSKLVNSLSWGRRVMRPESIGPQATILRIDLRDYAWTADIWDKIQAADPYALKYDFADAQFCYEQTECELPVARGDWFVHTAARPPLYHEILQLPDSDRNLEKLLRIDVAQNIEQDRVTRSGFNGSGVSRNNRLLERHESPYGAYWKSYDFAKNSGRANLFAHPLGPGKGDTSFAQDGGEIIFNLPNGLQAYLLVDADGKRLDQGPIAIVSDPKSADKSVVNGLSCMSCHVRGMIEKTDQVRDHILKFKTAFDESLVEKVAAIYPPASTFEALMREDAARFQSAVAATGAPLTQTDTVWSLANRFEERLDAPLAAAEAGVPESQLLELLDKVPDLARRLGPLATGQSVQRDVFTAAFDDVIFRLRQEYGLAVIRAGVDLPDLPPAEIPEAATEQIAAASASATPDTADQPDATTVGQLPQDTVERPGAINPTGDVVTARTALAKGQAVQVRQGDFWWRAEVLAAYRDGTVDVAYVGWDEQETVRRDRILIAPRLPDELRLPDADSGPISPTGIPVTAATPLRVGDFVEVEQYGGWWKGRVLRLQPDGDVLIHYLGYPEEQDEAVARSRILLPRTVSHAGAYQ